MKVWTVAATTLTLLSGLAIGAAVAPGAGAQSRTAVRAEPTVLQLLGGGGRLGVSVRDADAEEAKRAKLPSAAGVVIEDVREDSPAQKAGFREGDVVVEFDGERVRGTRQFTRLVQETPVERDVQAVVVRDGQRTTLTVRTEGGDTIGFSRDFEWPHLRIAPRPPVPPSPPTPAPPPFQYFPRIEQFFSSSGRLGITVDSLSEQLADYFGTKDGVLVTSVSTNSAAAKAGLKAGDVITAMNGTAVDSPAELARRTQRLDDGEEFTLEIVRDKKTTTIKGKVEPRQSRRWTTAVI
jgi:S1-C subfamily serine protease